MAATPESKVKKKVQNILKELGCYYFSPIGGPYSTKGVPDIIVCYKACFIGIECKAKDNKPTALQEKNLQAIRDAGGLALVIDETNVDMLRYKIEYHLETL